MFQEFPAACLHRRCARSAYSLQKFDHLFFPARMAHRQFCQTLQRTRFHNGTAIIEIVLQPKGSARSFPRSEPQPWQHQRQMPAQFRLRRFVSQSEQFRLECRQQRWFPHRDFLRRVGRPHADDRVVAPQALDQLLKLALLSQNPRYDLIRFSNRSPVPSLQHPT